MDDSKAIWICDGVKIYPADVRREVLRAGLKSGDVVMGHFDLRPFGKIGEIRNKYEFYNTIIDILLSVVGPQGGLIVPAYTYSFCKGEVFDKRISSSTTGSMADVALKRFQENCKKQLGETIYRSDDPIFSCIGFGESAKKICQNIGTESFGAGSIYDHLYNENAKLMSFGFQFAVTYMHYVERCFHNKCRALPYRYDKVFSGTMINDDGFPREKSYTYYVRDLDFCEYNFSVIPEELCRRGTLETVKIGDGIVAIATARDIYDAIFEMLQEDVLFCLEKKCRAALEKHLREIKEKEERPKG